VTAKPNFFIVGAPKCGTTSLFYYLTQHPNFYGTGIKEPHFLCEDFPKLRRIKTWEAYEKLYTWVEPQHQVIGEASMTYMYSEVALQHIVDINPDSRIIYIVRNPADLLYSWYSQMLKTMNEEERDFARAWALQEERAAGRSLPERCNEPFFLQYRRVGQLGERLQNLQRYFPIENIHVVFNDDLRNKTAETYAEVLKFLELPPYTEVDFSVLNTRQIQRSKLLGRFIEYCVASSLGRTFTRIKRKFRMGKLDVAQMMRELNMKTPKQQELSPELRRIILDDLREDIQLLSKLTGRNLDDWLE